MPQRHLIASLSLALFATALAPAVVHAQYSGRSSRSSSSSSSRDNNQNSASVQASKQVTLIKQDIQKLQLQQNKIRAKLRAQLLAKPEWASINAEVAKAKAAYDAAVKPAMARLRARPEYKALLKKRDDAQAIRDKANTDPTSVSNDELNKALRDYQEASIAMIKMEKEALETDPKVTDAKAKYDDAKAKLAQLDSQVNDTIKSDPEYLALEQQITQAKDQLVGAQQQLAQARQQELDQREQEAKQRQQSQRSGTGGR